MASYLVISVVTGFMMLSLSAIGLWSAATAVMDEPFSFGTIYRAALVYYPAVLVMIGCTVFLIGFVQKLSSLIWLYVVYTFFVLYLGGLFDFPEWVEKLTPFSHIPQLPVADMDGKKIMLLLIIAFVLAILGFIGYRGRDVEG